MKTKHFFLISFLLLCQLMQAQMLRGKIIDAETKDIISYAHLGIEAKSIGAISDEKGIFQLDLSNTKDSDLLSFSSIGYKKKTIPLKELDQDYLVIALEKENYDLEQITVQASSLIKQSTKQKKIGRTVGRSNYTGSSRIGWGGEIGIKIRAKKKIYKVEKLNFKIMEISHDSILFRMNIHEIKKGLPSKSILGKPIFIMGRHGEEWVSKSIGEEQIFLEDDVIVTIESIRAWSSNQRGGGVFYSNGRFYSSKTYFKEASMDQWKVGNDPKLSLYLNVTRYKRK